MVDDLDPFHFDAACYRKDELELSLPLLSPGRLLFGTDFGCPGKNFVRPQMLNEFVGSLEMSGEEKEGILRRKLVDFLKVNVPAK